MIVADNSLISYFTIEGEFTEEAVAVREKDPVWAAPLLWRSEFLNVLWLTGHQQILSGLSGDLFAFAPDRLGVPLVTHDGEVLTGFPETAVHPSDFLDRR
ncbi:MAG: hypothetical protein BRD35_00930 [Bacteroidetes bacterium QH_7_62_13]|nr:MAG: hypothetical protein BRD35_00930 [Bacteroidetes bacterium QH_7_62_13]